MFLRSALLACVAAANFAALTPALADTTGVAPIARCAEMTFRVYFDDSSTALNGLARQTLNVAERQLADCPYAELHVRMDASAPYARQRGDAIIAAAQERSWNVARVESRGTVQRAAYSSPGYAEVVMTPRVMPLSAPLPAEHGAGV